MTLVEVLEPAVSVKAKEELAHSLVRVMHHLKLSTTFLADIVMAELNKLGKWKTLLFVLEEIMAQNHPNSKGMYTAYWLSSCTTKSHRSLNGCCFVEY